MTSLREAVEHASPNKPTHWPSETVEDYDERYLAWLRSHDVIVDAARRWDALDSDENVEAAAKALCLWAMGEGVWEKDYQDMWRDQARAALGAVKDGGGVEDE